MPSNLSFLLNRFLDLYKRDVEALHRTLDDPTFVFSDAIPVYEQLEILSKSEHASQAKIRRNTLINTAGHLPRHALIQRELGDSREVVAESNSDKLLERLREKAKFERIHGERDYAAEVKQWQASEGTAVELLRFFADRIDSAAAAFDGLPQDDFDELLPQPIRTLFRECHISIALGSVATCCILCGAILESALKYSMPGTETKLALAANAMKRGLFTGKEHKIAVDILKTRDSVVHVNPKFHSVGIQDAYKTLLATRKLIAKLYSAKSAKEKLMAT